MIRGTTPRLTFILPFETSLVKTAFITFTNKEETVVLEKEFCDCNAEGNNITAVLTQEDTLKLPEGEIVNLQLRVLTQGGEALASEIFKVFVEAILKEGVIE